jgi:hypothetical protein
MSERFFYHSFPRRIGVDHLKKGCKILRSMCDIGLLLVPEYFEWRQPTTSGTDRIFPMRQQRACFTELAPNELPRHAEIFGKFALEFEASELRKLGATPVFYIPQPTVRGDDGNSVGVGLVSFAMDSLNLLDRIAALDKIFKGSTPVEEKLEFTVGFTGNPDEKKKVTIDVAETKILLEALGHMLTPWQALAAGSRMMTNFFYPADNQLNKKDLDYYRQREWRIAGQFAINGEDLVTELTDDERQAVRLIDPEFFDRNLITATGEWNRLAGTLALRGFGGKKVIDYVRRVIAPSEALDEVKEMFAKSHPTLPIVPIESLK